MERFKVSGSDLQRHYQGQVLLGDVFRDIERDLKAEERVVCQYIVNGLALEEKEESRFASLSLSEIETLEYVSEKADVLVVDVVQGWIQAIPELIGGAESLAEQIRQGTSRGLIKAVHDLTENCEFLIGSIWSARQMIGDAMGVSLGDFERLDTMTRQTVAEAVRRLETQDFVHLAQVIEYDLNHCLEEWRRVLLNFRDVVQNSHQGRKSPSNDGDSASTEHSVGRGKTPH